MGRIILATTTRYNDPQEMRARLAVELLNNAQKAGIRAVVVDGSPPPNQEAIREMLAVTGAQVLGEPEQSTMGVSRRCALRHASTGAGPRDAIVWIEPEKAPLVPFLEQICEPIHAGRVSLVVPGRTDKGLSSYPPVQAAAERLGNAVFARLTGRAYDPWFGPRACSLAGLSLFTEYSGAYGDHWDSIFIPLLRAARAGLRMDECRVEYRHPPEQTAAEDDIQIGVLKRFDQLQNLVSALCAETVQLGLTPARR